MMKIIRMMVLSIFMLCSFVHVKAQNMEYKNALTFNFGFSMVSSFMNIENIWNSNVSTNSIPAFQVNFDRAVENYVSIGAAFSYQRIGIDYTDFSYQGITGNYTSKMDRYNVALRTLFHYANNGKLDMYSGVRMGFTKWAASTNVPDPSYSPDNDWVYTKEFRFAPQLILFGMRLYAFENLGLNYEFGIGAPHYFTFGLAYRIH